MNIKKGDYLSMEKRIGYLQMDESGRYEVRDQLDNYMTYFTSGDAMELYLNGGWHKGRVEFSKKYGGYYFLDENDKPECLYNGYEVRV